MDATNRHKGQDPIVREYSRLAAEYDARWSFYIEATTRATITRLPLLATGRVLDVGCGTGTLLEKIASRFPQVTVVGVDPLLSHEVH